MSPTSAGRDSTLTTTGGRTLAFLEVGDPHGPVVIHNHGGPSSRFEVRAFAAAADALGLRIVGVDRPGCGGSSPQASRTFEGWTRDLVSVADHLGAKRFAVTGWSEGGPWALAAAAYLDSSRLAHVATIAGGSYGAFGANWAAKYLSAADALGGWLALHMFPGFKMMYAALGAEVVKKRGAFAKQIAKAVSDDDRRVLALPGVEDAFLDAAAECFAHGADGLVRDARVLYEAWPFDVTAIARAVHFWQGTEDHLVPLAINKVVAERMPSAVWHEVAGAGHFVAIREAHAIFGAAAADLR